MATQHESPKTPDVLILAPQPFYQERGTPIAVRLLAEELADTGYSVDLLTYHEGLPFVHERVALHRIPAPPGIHRIKPGFSLKKIICDGLMLIKSIGLVRKKHYRILHAVEESVFIALLLCLFFRIPYIYDMDSLLSRQLADMFPWIGRYSGLLQWFEKWAMRKSKGVLVVCDELKKTVQKTAPAIPVAVLEDISLLDEQGENAIVDNIRQAYQINGSILMYVGNLEKYQGIDLLLHAFALLPQEQQESDLVLIGGRDEDIDKYRQKSLSLGIAERVHFLGPKPVEHLGQYLQQADILVSPRVQGNNTPMKLYSYLASGKPVVATRLPTHTQVLDEDTALLCEPEAAAFMHAMHTLINNKGLQVQLGRAAECRAQQHYSRPAYRAKLHCFYRDVLGPPAFGPTA
jgi:glycosyltransferase involved in cell wall biosynthesis